MKRFAHVFLRRNEAQRFLSGLAEWFRKRLTVVPEVIRTGISKRFYTVASEEAGHEIG